MKVPFHGVGQFIDGKPPVFPNQIGSDEQVQVLWTVPHGGYYPTKFGGETWVYYREGTQIWVTVQFCVGDGSYYWKIIELHDPEPEVVNLPPISWWQRVLFWLKGRPVQAQLVGDAGHVEDE